MKEISTEYILFHVDIKTIIKNKNKISVFFFDKTLNDMIKE